jgi:hypothetical protein
MTPYVDVTYAHSRIDTYTGTSGGFPVRCGRSKKDTEVHLGADAAYALSSHTKLLGRLEAAHRFESTGVATSGAVLGLFSFNLPAQQIRRDWLRLAAGVESRLGPGVASAMLNVTSQGAVPSYWLNVSYQVAF